LVFGGGRKNAELLFANARRSFWLGPVVAAERQSEMRK
jgi:hypothetical protein